MTSEEIAKLRKLMAEATPGPWIDPEGTRLQPWQMAMQTGRRGGSTPTSALIVAAVNALPGLLDELEDYLSSDELAERLMHARAEAGLAKRDLMLTQGELSKARGGLNKALKQIVHNVCPHCDKHR